MSAVRKLGRDQIEARIKAIESGQKTPTDLLNQILQLACKWMMHPVLVIMFILCSFKWNWYGRAGG